MVPYVDSWYRIATRYHTANHWYRGDSWYRILTHGTAYRLMVSYIDTWYRIAIRSTV